MAPVVEESAEELDVAREIEEDKVRNLEHMKRLIVVVEVISAPGEVALGAGCRLGSPPLRNR